MALSNTKQDYAAHLHSLCSQWENLLQHWPAPHPKYYTLYERSKNILDLLCSDSQEFLGQLDSSPTPSNIERFIGKLVATRFDLNDGFLRFQIQDEVAIDLMQQAKELLEEGRTGESGYLPAAVLAGAVLENFLRTLCARQSPPITVKRDNGAFKMLATLVDELETAKLYNSAESKQIKVWVTIRNFAAHGQFADFDLKQVEAMIMGISAFIEKHGVES